MKSPYARVSPKKWPEVTRGLLERHPLKASEIVEIVLEAWESIFQTRMGRKRFRIGEDIFPKPQMMGFFLHELVPLEIAARYPDQWSVERTSGDKGVVYLPDEYYSIEIKTSSNPSHIFGNRSYAQKTSTAKKAKSGHYLAINFGKFTGAKERPRIRLIRFGWLDARDWIGQKAATGQQSRLPREVENGKLLRLYPSA